MLSLKYPFENITILSYFVKKISKRVNYKRSNSKMSFNKSLKSSKYICPRSKLFSFNIVSVN